MSPILKLIFSFNRNDKIIISISLAVLLLTSIALYFDLNKSSGGGSGKQIGVLRIKNNIAQRKFDEQVIWENLENEIPLYNNDSIRTGELSAATIVLNDKTEIEIDESSMIVLSIDDENMNINFVSGSIQAKTSQDGDESSDQQLTITSKDQVINIDDSDIQLNKGSGEELVVNVKRGTASIKSEDGKEQTINENERAKLNEDGKIEIRKISLLPQSPASGSTIFSQDQKQAVGFSWNPLEGNQAVQIEIDNRRNFNRPIVRTNTNQNTYSTSLGSGIYYWRISAINNQTKKREFSEIRKFTIMHNAPLKLHSPTNGSRFEYVHEPPAISFSWGKNDLATGYTVIVSKNSDFSDSIYNQNVNNTGISINLPEGQYYWKVSSNSSLSGASSSSSVSSLVVSKKLKTEAPTPIQPINEKMIPRAYFEKSGVTFNWDKSAEIKLTQLEISNSSSFSNLIHKLSSATNFAKIQKSLPAGSYYWRLIATDTSGNKTDYSKTASFTVGDAEKISVIRPVSNENFDEQTSQYEGINLTWKKTQIFGNFLVEVSNSSNFGKIVKKANVTGLSHTVKGLGKGKWYWRVSLMDQSVVLGTSDTGSFEISDTFLPPTILSPPENSVLDLTNRNNFVIEWKKSNGAVHYNVSIRYNNAIIMQRKLTETQWRINDFSKLNKGSFVISVQACRSSGQPLCTPERHSRVDITLKEPDTPIIIPDEEVFIIEE